LPHPVKKLTALKPPHDQVSAVVRSVQQWPS